MASSLANPYYGVGAIRDANMFFGRTHTLRRIYSAIANRQCISLVGSLHLGKSSLLHCMRLPEIQRRFEYDLSRHILVCIDLRAYLRKSAEDFFKNVTKEIIAQSRDHLELTLPQLSGEDAFCDILDQINDQDYYPVLAMDAFDKITRNQNFDPEFFSFLRSQAGQVSYVTASVAPLYEVSHSAIQDSPFFNIFDTHYLEALTEAEACDLIELPARSTSLSFTPDEVAWVLKMAGRHPFFIQRVCYHLFEEKYLSDVPDCQRLRKRIYDELLPHFESIWRSLSEKQRELLKDEARIAEAGQRNIPELSESALFRRFVLDQCQVQLFQMTMSDVEKALDRIDDLQFLGECDLKYMKQLAPALSNGHEPTLTERGKAVRDALVRALERMRGEGVRRDTDTDWRLYNILHYRYFRYHLKNEQISARLGFNSLRQYYRERTKAIAALYNALLEVEAIED